MTVRSTVEQAVRHRPVRHAAAANPAPPSQICLFMAIKGFVQVGHVVPRGPGWVQPGLLRCDCPAPKTRGINQLRASSRGCQGIGHFQAELQREFNVSGKGWSAQYQPSCCALHSTAELCVPSVILAAPELTCRNDSPSPPPVRCPAIRCNSVAFGSNFFREPLYRCVLLYSNVD